MHRGIDVSNYQGTVNFRRVAEAGYRFVDIKASEGVGYTDPHCLERHHEARHAGLHAGFYHFLRPRPGRNGAHEAEYFWSVVKGVRGGEHGAELLRLVVDVEVTDFARASELPDESVGAGRMGIGYHVDERRTLSAGADAQTREYARDFLARLTDLASHLPALYTFPAFLPYWGHELARYPLWIAHYGVPHPHLPAPFHHWAIWQHTSGGHVPGVHGGCDVNRCPELAGLILERNRY